MSLSERSPNQKAETDPDLSFVFQTLSDWEEQLKPFRNELEKLNHEPFRIPPFRKCYREAAP